jgi:predicted Zn-dependent protease
MAIDQYAICPCGSGKKIKFCKCFDSIGELDRVTKMVQGGQMVAAIDRLNQVFKQHPSAAWALAIKGRLLIGMDELNTLSENADRFIQLQPSNPLALAQKAAAQAGQGKYSEAAYSVLQALAESGQSVDSFIIEICGMLAVGLYRQGIVLSSRMFATIALMASQDEQYQRLPRMVLEELNGSQDINLLLKTLPTTIPRPADVSWGERYDEAQSLLYSNQILASESKLEALDRQHPNEPAIMMSLFVCAIWRADPAAQACMLSKVSVALANDPEKAARLQAVAWLVGGIAHAVAGSRNRYVGLRRRRR